VKKLLSVFLVLAFFVGSVTVIGCGDTKSTGTKPAPTKKEGG
jgi:hypothetical protein